MSVSIPDTNRWYMADSKILGTVRNVLTYRYLPTVLAILAMGLVLPSVWQRWAADDLIHRKMLLTSTLPAVLRRLFVFASPDKNLQLMDLGIDLGTMPWWTLDMLRISFFRPVAVLTHWLDYQLWPDSGVLMHAQSILWYGGVCILASLVYRRLIGPTWVAGLAAFLFAVDIVHLGSVTWLANRNALLALFFGLLALLAHDRWRREGSQASVLLASAWLALALLSAETGVATGVYILVYAIFVDRGTWSQRLGSLAPYAAVVGVWRLIYQHLGYGAWGSGFYVDPVRESVRFAAAVLERGPILLLSQWVGQIPMLYNLLSLPASRIVWLIALLFMALVGVMLVPLVREDRVARFWGVGMVLAVVPACSISLLSGRLLLFASLGAMGLMAQFIGGLLDRSGWLLVHRAWRIPAWTLALLLTGFHAVLAPILMPFMVNIPDVFQTVIAQVTDIGPLPEAEQQDVIIVNAPSPFHFIYVPSLRSVYDQPMPARIRVLAPGYSSVHVTRLDTHTVVVQPEHGYLVPAGVGVWEDQGPLPPFHYAYMYQLLEKFFRSNAFPMTLGQQVELTGMDVKVTALTDDGRPREARVRFTLPLEDPSLNWLQWDWEKLAYVSFTPPAIGKTVWLPEPSKNASGRE